MRFISKGISKYQDKSKKYKDKSLVTYIQHVAN